jgi:hypothetical protein
MAFKGTGRRSARDLAEAVEEVGGEMNAETSVDHTSYHLRLLKDDIDLGLDVLGDIVSDPLLDPEELTREQHVILQEIGAAQDTPDDWVFEIFQEAAFPDQAIGRSILGTPESISAHAPGDLRRFLGSHYSGTQTVLAAAGNLDHDRVVRLAEEHLGRPARPPGACSRTRHVYRRRHDRAAPAAGSTRSDGLFRPLLCRSVLPRRPCVLVDLGRRHGFPPLSGDTGEPRALLSIYSFYWPFTDTGLFASMPRHRKRTSGNSCRWSSMNCAG